MHSACDAPLPAPPGSEGELLRRALALAGRRLEEVAGQLGLPAARQPRHAKGWAGSVLEAALGASAGSRPIPDFPALGVEMKTLPVTPEGRPLESTYVCTVPLQPEPGLCWEGSALRAKLARVLWVPLVCERPDRGPAQRRIGTPVLWSPSAEEDAALRLDWEELMELVAAGELERVTAHLGQWLQIRPKAADGRARTRGTARGGDSVPVLPRGFYLRPAFTADLLRRHYLVPAARR